MQNEFFNDEMLNRMYRFKKQIFKKFRRTLIFIVTKYYEISNIGNSNWFISSMKPSSQLTIFKNLENRFPKEFVSTPRTKKISTSRHLNLRRNEISRASNIGNSSNRFIGWMKPPSRWKIAEQLRIEKVCPWRNSIHAPSNLEGSINGARDSERSRKTPSNLITLFSKSSIDLSRVVMTCSRGNSLLVTRLYTSRVHRAFTDEPSIDLLREEKKKRNFLCAISSGFLLPLNFNPPFVSL